MKLLVICLLLVSSVNYVFSAPYGNGYGETTTAVPQILDVVTQQTYEQTTQGYGTVTQAYGETTTAVPQILDVVTQQTYEQTTQGYGAVTQAYGETTTAVSQILDVATQQTYEQTTQGYGAVAQPALEVVTSSYGGNYKSQNAYGDYATRVDSTQNFQPAPVPIVTPAVQPVAIHETASAVQPESLPVVQPVAIHETASAVQPESLPVVQPVVIHETASAVQPESVPVVDSAIPVMPQAENHESEAQNNLTPRRIRIDSGFSVGERLPRIF